MIVWRVKRDEGGREAPEWTLSNESATTHRQSFDGIQSVQTTFIQTADAFGYRKMLSYSADTVTEYCRRHRFSYESFIGIKRGAFAWHATFNRIPMLSELVARGHDGWVIYLDADAYVFDLDFDLRSYLAEKQDAAAIMVSMGCEPRWAVNAGVFMLNLGHEGGRRIVERWAAKFAELSDAQLAGMEVWDDGLSDQSMLFEVLDEDATLRDAVHYESSELINGNYSRFIRQLLRAYYPVQSEREQAIRNAASEVLGGEGDDLAARAYPAVISALYRVLLGRDPDAAGMEHYGECFRREGIEIGFRDALAGFMVSPEYLERRAGRPDPADATQQVRAAYQWLFDREADASGLAHYVRAISEGEMNIGDLRAIFVKSEEFASKVRAILDAGALADAQPSAR